MAAALIWFRDDLRLKDNPALTEAAREGRPLAALFVLDEETPGIRPLGGAARWWLAQSLRALQAELGEHGIPLVLKRGSAETIVPEVASALSCDLVAFNSRSGAGEAKADAALARALKDRGHGVHVDNGHLLHVPGTVLTTGGSLPRTFTAFHRAAQRSPRPRLPLRLPAHLSGIKRAPEARAPEGERLEDWDLEPEKPDWAGGLREAWASGEAAAHGRLAAFIKDGLKGYADQRDRPAAHHVSRLSPHLRWGELSPNQVLYAVRHAAETGAAPHRDAEKLEAELYWREFSHHVLHAEPNLCRHNLQRQFDHFPWRECPGELKAWQRGCTGYPLVDAGLRQLWKMGWMHNRVRLVVGSFLAKHLLIDWRIGEAWFWDTLVDADVANNPGNWQWVAGTGVDAAPYFRIFNPVLQGEKFDPDGDYVRAFVPELAKLPNKFIHRPWEADEATLAKAGVKLGATYPKPLIAHEIARARALRAFEHIKGK